MYYNEYVNVPSISLLNFILLRRSHIRICIWCIRVSTQDIYNYFFIATRKIDSITIREAAECLGYNKSSKECTALKTVPYVGTSRLFLRGFIFILNARG